MSDLIHADIESSNLLVADQQILDMLDNCAGQIERANSVGDARKAADVAEAIMAVTHKIKASDRIRRAALAIRVQAEQQLGRITKKIKPTQGYHGAKGKDLPTRGKILAESGISLSRASIAQRLADTPQEKIDKVVNGTDKPSLSGLVQGLGIRHRDPAGSYSAIKKLAFDAIGLLVICQTEGRAPTAEEVAPMRQAFSRLHFTTRD